MSDVYFIDYETYSEADLKELGSYRYACDPSTKILLCAIAKNDGPVLLWDSADLCDSEEAYELILEMARNEDSLVVAHNVGFEIPVSRYLFEPTFGEKPPALDRWRCTAAMCRRAAIPFNLKGAAEFLKLDAQKADMGKELIKYFSVPSTAKSWRVNKEKVTRERAWQLFGDYCRQDVEVERQIWKRLKKSFGLDNQWLTLAGFQFDLRMNERGLPVNVDALTKAGALLEAATGPLEAEFAALTGLAPTQREKLLAWLQERGYPEDNLQAATMEAVLADPPVEMKPEALRALELRAGSAFAAVAKIPVMRNMACPDARVRGCFMWSGALRTHRWAGRGVQPQNFKRPVVKDHHLAYELLKGGHGEETFSDLFGTLPETLASCVRHFIEAPGVRMLDGDYANIEARITPWLCGQEDMLDEFRRGEDIYKVMAGFIFGKRIEKVSKQERFVGKQATLACQFQVGADKFKMMCAQFGQDLPDDLCKMAVEKYREKRDRIVRAWRLYNEAAKDAIRNPKQQFHVNHKVTFCYGDLAAGFPSLQMRLPSGHVLNYPLAKIETVMKRFKRDEPAKEVEQIVFWGPHPTKAMWCWNSTYGGKLLENATQATGGDFMTEGLLNAEESGFEPFATIHDQALALQTRESHTVERFRAALCKLPSWAKGFPLEASCDLTDFYTKDD